MIDELQLFRGKDYIINYYITIHHPKLNEICDFSEKKYFGMVSGLTATPSDYKVQLYDMNVDYTEISEFEFFYLMCRSLTPDDTGILFGDLDFSKFTMAKNKENEELVLYDETNDYVIDKTIYALITEYIRSIHLFKKRVDKAGNIHTKKYLIDSERRRQERLAKKPYKSILVPLISAMTNCEQFKYNHDTVWDLPIYTFNDSVRRIQKIKNYNQIMQGAYFGTVDIKEISQDEINWLGSLD